MRIIARLVLLPLLLLAATQTFAAGFYFNNLTCARVLLDDLIPTTHFKTENRNANPAEIKDVKFMEFNVLNLHEQEKAQYQVEGVGRMQRASDPDIMMLLEIWSQQAMENLNKQELNGNYKAFMVKGNDPRGLELGAMWKNTLPFDVEVRSYKNLMHNEKTVFSRDIPAFIFRLPGHSAPVFVMLGAHLKSKRSLPDDHLGFKKRELEVSAAIEVMHHLEKEFTDKVPLIFTGDLNNHLPTSAEFKGFKAAGYTDVFAHLQQRVVTHFYFSRNRAKPQQLDGFLMNSVVYTSGYLKSAKIIPHLDENGQPMAAPRSYREREYRASDHVAVEVVLDFAKIYADWLKRQRPQSH